MEATIREVWQILGIPQLWGAVLTVTCVVIAFLLKRLLDLRLKRHDTELEALASQFADIGDYVKEQSVGLMKAYFTVFENQSALEAQGAEFSKLVRDADDELMRPFRRYRAKIDKETESRIFEVHNILAQYYPSASEEAIGEFKQRKSDFYALIENTLESMRPDAVMYRLGLISRTLQRKRG